MRGAGGPLPMVAERVMLMVMLVESQHGGQPNLEEGEREEEQREERFAVKENPSFLSPTEVLKQGGLCRH